MKYRAARTDPACAPSARVAIRGGQAQPVRAGSGGDRQLPPARPAISAAGISQPQPVLPARRGRCAIVAARSMSSRRQNRRVHVPGSSDPRCSHWPGPGAARRPPQARQDRAACQHRTAGMAVLAGRSARRQRARPGQRRHRGPVPAPPGWPGDSRSQHGRGTAAPHRGATGPGGPGDGRAPVPRHDLAGGRNPGLACWHRGQASRPKASMRQPALIARARVSASPSAAGSAWKEMHEPISHHMTGTRS